MCKYLSQQEIDGCFKMDKFTDNVDYIFQNVFFDEFLNLAENPDFRNRELAIDLLLMKLHPELAEAFRKQLFPQ